MTLTRVLVAVALVAAPVVSACAQGNLPQPVQAAIADLAKRLDVAAEQITVENMERVTWPNTSLGNPQPGMMYPQVLTQGYRVILRHEDESYEYHTDMGTTVTLLEPDGADVAPAPVAEPGSELDETETRLWMIATAKQHLAWRMGTGVADVFLASLENALWPDASLGMPQPGETYAQVETPGYRMLLETAQGLTAYHSDLSGTVVSEIGPVTGAMAAMPPGGGRADPAAAAIADLADRLGVSADAITVVNVEEIDWPDSALGLPEPGMMYPQAIVPGYLIVLGAQGREFEYHAARQGRGRFAGVRYPEDAGVAVLHLAGTEPADGNNFFHLVRSAPDGADTETVCEFVSDFATTPDGLDIAVVRRTSRSTHELAYVNDDGTTETLATAFDFGQMAWDSAGARLAFWSRATVGTNEVRLSVLVRPSTEPSEIALPDRPAGSFNPGNLVWTNDGLAITILAEGGVQSFFWDGEAVRPMGPWYVMAWIPRTSCVVARALSGDVVTLMPGRDEPQTTLGGAEITSVAAPAEGGQVIATAGAGDGLRLLRVTWDGSSTQLATMSGAVEARVRVAPVGNVATVSYQIGDGGVSDVLGLAERSAELLTTIHEPGPAVPVAH